MSLPLSPQMKKDKLIQIRIRENLKKKFKKLADKKGITISEYLTDMIKKEAEV